MERVNALSIDIEDWYHPELVRKKAGPCPVSQVSEATQPVLRLLDSYGVKATFFILGEVAERHPGLIRSIVQKGHEIGCHGFSHRPLWDLDEARFVEEIEHFYSVMKGILTGANVKGFRAPTFSLDQGTKWALPILLKMGFHYDASLFPVRLNPLYGVRGAPLKPYRLSMEDVAKEDPLGSLLEFPMSLLEIGRFKIPLSGGFYMRVLPRPFLYWGLKRISRSRPFIVYFHPWEGCNETPRMKLPLYNRLITYYGIRSALGKLEFLLKHFKFAPIDQVLGLAEKT